MPFHSTINIINKTGFIMTLDLPLPSPTFGVYYTAPGDIPVGEHFLFVVGADKDGEQCLARRYEHGRLDTDFLVSTAAKGSQGELSYTIGNPASCKAEVSYVCNSALNNNVMVDIPHCEFYATYGPPTDNQKKQTPLTGPSAPLTTPYFANGLTKPQASATIHKKEL